MNTWIGTDADLEISLLEYGVVAKQPEKRDHKDEWFVLYKSGEIFDTGWKRESELDAIVKGEEWADKDQIKNFLDYVGMTTEDWLDLSFIHKIQDLNQYWGMENIMGITYYDGIKQEEALEMLEE